MTTATAPKQQQQEELPRMSFGDHLDELRRRMIRALIAIAVVMFVLLPFKTEVTEVYVQPYQSMWLRFYEGFLEELDAKVEAKGGVEHLGKLEREQFEFHAEYGTSILDGTFDKDQYGFIETKGNFRLPRTLKALGGLEDFWIFMAATILFALILASPIVLYQAWAFISAGLYRSERRVVRKYVPFSIGLLCSGVAFGYLVVVPYGLYWLVKWMNFDQVEPMLSVSQYFSLLFMLITALGIVFQLPLVMLALQKTGLVSHEVMRKNWRYVILGCFTVSMFLTPPDPFTQAAMAGPMVILYCFGLILTGRSSRQGSGHAGEPA